MPNAVALPSTRPVKPCTGQSARERMRYTHPVQTPDQLNEEFAIPDRLGFDEPYPGMPRARVATPVCTAELYLQGAHLTHWQPAGHEPVLFLSSRSSFTHGKAIRGGIPVIFPWFGSPETSPVHPPGGSASHGFARVWPWTLRFAALMGDEVHLSLTVDHNDRLHAMGFDFLQLGIDIVLGERLSVRLTSANMGGAPFLLEEALHTYLTIGDVHQVAVEGLAGKEYLDKTKGFQRETQTEDPLHFTAETDRPYLNAPGPVSLVDPVLKRRLTVAKSNSQTTVVWNPAAELTAKLPDLAQDEWHHFACLETANAADNAVMLQPQQPHTMAMELSVERL